MVLNSFSASGENENQNLVATGVSGLTANMLSSQFSNILQRFVSGVDINVNLNTATNRYVGTTEGTDVEIGVSTKFFGDRNDGKRHRGRTHRHHPVRPGRRRGDRVQHHPRRTAARRFRQPPPERLPEQPTGLPAKRRHIVPAGIQYLPRTRGLDQTILLREEIRAARRKARAERKAERMGEQPPLTAPAADTLDTVPGTLPSDSATAKISFR